MNLTIELRDDHGDFIGGTEHDVSAAELMALPRFLKETLEPAAAQLRKFYEDTVVMELSRRLQSDASVSHTDKHMN